MYSAQTAAENMDAIRLVGSTRTAVENAAGKFVYDFFLAALSDLYAEVSVPDDFEFSAENGYDTFENLIADEPDKKAKRPLTVMRDAKTILASLFAALVSVVNETGRLPAVNIKDHLANARATNVDPVRFMIFTAEALWPKITAEDGNLSRDLNSVECFRAKIEALVNTKGHVDPGSDELARIYVRFLKCVAWGAANFAVEHKITLNGWFLCGLFRNFGGHPGVDFDEGLREYFGDQLDWIADVDTAKKAPAPKRAAAPKPAAEKPAEEPAAEPAAAVEAETEKPAEEAEKPAAEPAADAAAAAPAANGSKDFSYDDLMTDLADL